MYTISQCITHGTKAVADLASLYRYVTLAQVMADNEVYGEYFDEGLCDFVESHACCPAMVIDPYGHTR